MVNKRIDLEASLSYLSFLDIQFWRTRKSLEGLSVRSVFFNIFQSFVVLLYVFDNETNTMVRISVCVGILIELWKVPKVLNFQVNLWIKKNDFERLVRLFSARSQWKMARNHSKIQIRLQRIVHRHINIGLWSSSLIKFSVHYNIEDFSIHLDGIQILIMDFISIGDWLCVLFIDVSRTKELVFILFKYCLWFSFDIR